jgi:hypothetical protein
MRHRASGVRGIHRPAPWGADHGTGESGADERQSLRMSRLGTVTHQHRHPVSPPPAS